MKGFLGLTKRNLLIFFKDKQMVVFSLLTSIIVLALYLLFLKGTYVDAMTGIIDKYKGLSGLIGKGDIDMFADFVLLTGIIGSAMITVPYNCLTTVVKDRENKVDYDILATPVKRREIILSYFISAALSSVLLTGIILTVGFLVIGGRGNLYMEGADILAAYGIVALGSVSATAFFMIVILFFNSSGASGAFFGMLSAASGFIIGAYIPISEFSDNVQTACNLFPAAHITVLLRNALMKGLLKHMDSSIGGVDGGMFVKSVRNLFSFRARMFGKSLGIQQMFVYVITCMMLCIVIQMIMYSKTYKK